MRSRGRVKWFSNRRGYGFIQMEDGQEIFIHYSEIQEEGFKSLDEGQEVEFDLVDNERGPQAARLVKL